MQFNNILVHVSPRSHNDPAITNAMAIAKRWNSTITVFDVSTDLSWPMQYLAGGWDETIEILTGNKKQRLRQRAESLTAAGFKAKHVMTTGRLSVATIKQVIQGEHDLVIKVAEDSGPNRSGFLGSTDYRLVRKCPCPVLILRHDGVVGFQRVAVAMDVLDYDDVQQQLDQRVLRAADGLCVGQLHLVYAMRSVDDIIEVAKHDSDLISPEQMAKWDSELHAAAEQKLETISGKFDSTRCTFHVLPGAPEESIPEFVSAHRMDLLAMGSVARSGLDGVLIGNTAERILKNVHCSILAIKSPEFVSPLASLSHHTQNN